MHKNAKNKNTKRVDVTHARSVSGVFLRAHVFLFFLLSLIIMFTRAEKEKGGNCAARENAMERFCLCRQLKKVYACSNFNFDSKKQQD
jgi:hypothetical protein